MSFSTSSIMTFFGTSVRPIGLFLVLSVLPLQSHSQGIEAPPSHACDPQAMIDLGLLEETPSNRRHMPADWICNKSSVSQIRCALDIVYFDSSKFNVDGFQSALDKCVKDELFRYTRLPNESELEISVPPISTSEVRILCDGDTGVLMHQEQPGGSGHQTYNLKVAQPCPLIQEDIKKFRSNCRMNFVVDLRSATVVLFEKTQGQCHSWN